MAVPLRIVLGRGACGGAGGVRGLEEATGLKSKSSEGTWMIS